MCGIYFNLFIIEISLLIKIVFYNFSFDVSRFNMFTIWKVHIDHLFG